MAHPLLREELEETVGGAVSVNDMQPLFINMSIHDWYPSGN